MRIKVDQLTDEAFRPFGRVLGQPDDEPPNLTGEMEDVWLGMSDLMGLGGETQRTVTYLKICRRPAVYDTLERHSTCAEAFIPLEGESILLVAPASGASDGPDPCGIRAFYMDGTKGVLLCPGVWHAVPYNISRVATFLVLVDDAIIEKNDCCKVPIEPVEFVRDEPEVAEPAMEAAVAVGALG